MDAPDTWIAARWLAPIKETRRLRLEIRRGRNLAKKGWVHHLDVKPGIATARVASDSSSSHDVQIRMDRIEDEIWDDAVERIAERAALAADILQGRLSEGLATVFEDCGHDLFPFDLRDLSNWCTCRSDSDVCVHAVATHFEFARLLSADPLALLEFRGRSREQLFEELRVHRDGGHHVAGGASEEGASVEPYEVLAHAFWERDVVPRLAFPLGRGELAEEDYLPVLSALGPGPASIEPADVITVLAPLMRTAQARVEDIVQRASEEAEDLGLDPAGAQSLDDLLVAAAHQHGALTSSFVADALGITTREARQYLKWLVEEGRLVAEGKSRAIHYVVAERPGDDGEDAALERQ